MCRSSHCDAQIVGLLKGTTSGARGDGAVPQVRRRGNWQRHSDISGIDGRPTC